MAMTKAEPEYGARIGCNGDFCQTLARSHDVFGMFTRGPRRSERAEASRIKRLWTRDCSLSLPSSATRTDAERSVGQSCRKRGLVPSSQR